MMKKFAATAIACTFFGLSSAASAAVYDFTAEGNRFEQGYSTFVTGVTGGNPMPTGLTITASSTVDDQDPFPIGTPDTEAFVYMDGTTTGPGGLGVCGDLRTNGTCEPNGDDNQIPGETVNILLAPNQIVDSMTFTGDHKDIVAGTMLNLTIDGNLSLVDLGALPAVNKLTLLSLGVAASSISYFITGAGAQIYLSAMSTSAVPVPAAFWLFGTALLGFISYSRRTRI